jgi:methyl-accepting chemotaxis protein
MKLKDIKEISSDSVRIITEFGSPGMTESLNRMKEIASVMQETTKSFDDPQMVQNIENVRKAFEAMKDAGDRMKNVLAEVKGTGIIDEAKDMADSVKNMASSNNQNLKEFINTFKDTLRSVKSLANESRHSK